mgnify:CR=1 FL=1|tara:strand:- start:48 stop:203 length:156 start_codon:yes stop_codon:yes gene_type:complete
MGKILGAVLKSLATEQVIKSILVVLGDYLVKSSKNQLDDVLWEKVKIALQK